MSADQNEHKNNKSDFFNYTSAEKTQNSVSVVIPAYNASEYINISLNSALNQSLKPFEIIIIDDASHPDESKKMELTVELDPCIRYLRLEQNGGPALARNIGIKQAQGEFIAFLDADDEWLPHKLATCIEFMNTYDEWFVGHNNLVRGAYERTICDKLRIGSNRYIMKPIDIFLSTSQFAPSCVVFRRTKLTRYFDESIRRSEDYRLWAELILSGHRLVKITDALARRDTYHIGQGGLSQNIKKIRDAHLETAFYLVRINLLNKISGFLLRLFIKAKFIRHFR